MCASSVFRTGGHGSASKNRCLVPVTSFAEPDPASQEEGGKVPNAWFARDQEKSLMFFVGIHVPQWLSVRKVRDGLTTGKALWVFDHVSQQPGEADPREGHARPVADKEQVSCSIAMSAFSVPVPPPKAPLHCLATKVAVARFGTRGSLTGVLANSKSPTRKGTTVASIPRTCRDGHGCASHAESSTPIHQ